VFYSRKQSKYHSVSQNYNGRHYRSKKEAAYAESLDLLKMAGEIKEWEYEKERIPLDVNGIHITSYMPDFWITMPDGSLEIHEVKGGSFMENLPVFKFKRLLFEATWLKDHPDVKYVVVT
jgi:hypothetical protein